MSKHTPTPWEAEERADTIKIGAVKGIYITKLGMGESGEYRDEQTANAELIVKAVNSHDALVEALSEAADIMESMGCPKRAVRSWRELVEKGSEA